MDFLKLYVCFGHTPVQFTYEDTHFISKLPCSLVTNSSSGALNPAPDNLIRNRSLACPAPIRLIGVRYLQRHWESNLGWGEYLCGEGVCQGLCSAPDSIYSQAFSVILDT